MNKKQKSLTNKGFSLVELIIVIAIMAVLVGVLAPQFIKYVEQSRRSTDIQNAENIKTAILADIADGLLTGTDTATYDDLKTPYVGDGTMASTITTAPTVQGNLGSLHGTKFTVTFNSTAGTCQVTLTNGSNTYDLTDADDAAAYKIAN